MQASESAEFVKPTAKSPPVSPLGWSITGRVLWAALASALLWLAVAWAIGLWD